MYKVLTAKQRQRLVEWVQWGQPMCGRTWGFIVVLKHPQRGVRYVRYKGILADFEDATIMEEPYCFKSLGSLNRRAVLTAKRYTEHGWVVNVAFWQHPEAFMALPAAFHSVMTGHAFPSRS